MVVTGVVVRYHPFGVPLVTWDTISRIRAIAFVIDLRRKFSGSLAADQLRVFSVAFALWLAADRAAACAGVTGSGLGQISS